MNSRKLKKLNKKNSKIVEKGEEKINERFSNGEFTFDLVEGNLLIFEGHKQYILERDLAKSLGLPTTGSINNHYNSAPQNLKERIYKERVTLSRDDNQKVRSLLNLGSASRPFKMVKLSTSLRLVGTSRSKYADIAMDVLEHYAEIGLAFVDAASKRNDSLRLNSIDKALSIIEIEKEKNSFLKTEMKKWQESDDPLLNAFALLGKTRHAAYQRRATVLTLKENEYVRASILNQLGNNLI
jgi:hypothetical protein